MPTPRKYSDPAARQAAYRARQAQAIRETLIAKGLPPAPVIPTIPGTARWNAIIEQVRNLLETARDEMQSYHDERSETWQEGERGESMRDKIDALDSLLSDLDTLPD